MGNLGIALFNIYSKRKADSNTAVFCEKKKEKTSTAVICKRLAGNNNSNQLQKQAENMDDNPLQTKGKK